MTRTVRYTSKSRDFLKTVRVDSQLKQVVIHHTEDRLSTKGVDLNKRWVQSGNFGVPYDIVIDVDGEIGLAPAWIYAQTANQFRQNVSATSILNYKYHHLAQAGDTELLNKRAIHIAFVGDFNVQDPTWAQLRAGQAVLREIRRKLSEIEITYHYKDGIGKCPGRRFFTKDELLGAI